MKRTLLVPLAVATLVSGCGPTTHLDLSLRSVPVTIPRLVTPAVTLVPPATGPVPVSLPPLPPSVVQLPQLPPPSAPPVQVPPPKPPACPTAGQFDVPAKPASPLVTKPPAPGRYTMNAFGTYAKGGTVKPLNGSVDVLVTALPSSTSAVGQQIDAWQVKRTDATSVSVEVYQLVHVSSSPAATAAGIYLVGLAWKDPVRGDLTFQAAGNGVLIVPDPVAIATSAAQYAGAATDPNSLTTLAIVRNVTGRKRVDACGRLIDTYTVAMTGTLVSPGMQRQLSWTQQIATAYGGSDVEDSFTLSSPVEGFTWTRTLRNTALPKEV
ncbi:MAG: hypothetical protein JWO22_4055 [Frankiales bacterium]|nr:hypothetical protein [Frankiales bacterium]